MTEQDLNVVRDLRKKIREGEQHLHELRISADNIVPVIDGLPHATAARSRVERITLKIIELENDLNDLRTTFEQAQSQLADRILCVTGLKPSLQSVLILRYVACLPHKDTARRLQITLRHEFKLHAKALNAILQA